MILLLDVELPSTEWQLTMRAPKVCVSEYASENDLNGNKIVNWMSGNHGC